MRRKHVIIMVIAWIVEISLTYWIATMFSVRFIEVMFFTGVAFTLGTFYFSSSGGAMSRLFASQVSAQTGIIHERERFQVQLGSDLYGLTAIFPYWVGFLYLTSNGYHSPTKYVKTT